MTELFMTYWWLLFPLMGLVFGLTQMVLRNSYERKKMDLMQTYLKRGQPIPESLKNDL